MSQGIALPNPVAAAQQQQAILNRLRIDIAVGIHRELVGRTFSFGPQCLPGDEWKLKGEDGEKVGIDKVRRAVAQEAVAQADALMEAFGFQMRPPEK